MKLRPTFLAAMLAAACWGLGAPPAPAAVPALADANCDQLESTKYWFCRALESSNCSLAQQEDYWLCRGLTDRNCNLVDHKDYWFCRGMTESNCNLVDRGDYWRCRGLTEDCELADTGGRRECEALSPFFRARSE
jgi:hypothetical protein